MSHTKRRSEFQDRSSYFSRFDRNALLFGSELLETIRTYSENFPPEFRPFPLSVKSQDSNLKAVVETT
ncbi:hypothetical protein DLM75_04825 [Leptospira stimsonii]|uniref:Uncharacterized protein n=1 Tax=Leptospira stimsonii TaxID=2202203 RepID=A0A396ZA93_9LEPT|nr:hypothetical protein DLM75_04825 [Leptospira stimsonii]